MKDNHKNEIHDFVTLRWLPHHECRLLSQVYMIARDGIVYAHYKKCITKNKSKLIALKTYQNEQWYINTKNTYYDLAIHNWGMLFRTDAEPTHYSKLLEYKNICIRLKKICNSNEITRNILLSHLLDMAEINHEKYCEYREKTNEYRNRYLIHREHSPDAISDGDLKYPELDILQKILSSFLFLIISVAQTYPKKKIRKMLTASII